MTRSLLDSSIEMEFKICTGLLLGEQYYPLCGVIQVVIRTKPVSPAFGDYSRMNQFSEMSLFFFYYSFTVKPIGFEETLTITVEVLCSCDCESTGVSVF